MITETKPRLHHKKEQLKDNIARLHACLKVMVKANLAYKNKSKLSDELGRRLDLDPSIFRKADSEHRTVLNQYLHKIEGSKSSRCPSSSDSFDLFL